MKKLNIRTLKGIAQNKYIKQQIYIKYKKKDRQRKPENNCINIGSQCGNNVNITLKFYEPIKAEVGVAADTRNTRAAISIISIVIIRPATS